MDRWRVHKFGGSSVADAACIQRAVHLTRSASPAVRDLVSGFGEVWSTRLFARYLSARGKRPGKVIWVDARDIVRVDWSPLGPSIRWEESRANGQQMIPQDIDATLVITGFIARAAAGPQTTLGRNRSDFAA